MRTRTRRWVALAAVSCLGLGACSSGTDKASGSGSGGWTEVTAGHLTLERPSSWTKATTSGDVWTTAYAGDGMELRLAGEFSEDPTASAAFSRLDLPATLNLTDYDGGSAKKFEVEGADTAIRSDFTFTDGGKPRKGIWIIAGQYPYPSTSAVAISGERLDDEVVQHILDSLSFEKRGQ